MSLEFKRKHLEIGRVNQAKLEMEFQIEELLENVERIKKNILIQEKRAKELEEELKKGDN